MAELDWLKLSGAVGEAKVNLQGEKAKLKAANARADSIILSPKDILTGKWDAARTLETTIDGGKVKRAITNADLVAFSQNIKTVQTKHKLNGIKAQQVIDLSNSLDRGRTSKSYKLGGKTIQPIRHAAPVQANGDIVRFITNAGGSTPGVNSHQVVVEFSQLSDLASAANRGAQNTSPKLFAKKLAQILVKTPLRFYCDCERHKYWYGYIATIGGFAVKPPYGLLQHGYPKITNPELDGIACKHVIRVMQEISGGLAIQAYLARHLEKMLNTYSKTAQTKQSQKDAEIIAKAQAKRVDHTIQTSDEKKNAAAEARAAKALQKSAGALPAPKQIATATKKDVIKNPGNTGLVDAQIAAIESALRSAGVPQSAIDAAINAARNAQ